MEKQKNIKSKEGLENTSSDEKTISVKFNKEVKEISLEEAKELAQKGLKYDAVSEIFERLKTLSADEGKSVLEYVAGLEKKATLKRAQGLIDSCSDKDELLELILNWGNDKKQKVLGFDELKTAYPEMDDISKVPEEVLQNAKLHGRNLFDEYLRYLFETKKREEKINKSLYDNKSIGSQAKKDNGSFDPISSRFLKGLWGN